ncbi:hypothetical protein FACS189449_02850 [Alphaproteobacteria bacterium]|nr:hypothetical protein FACS189449_02850 [Alphaproteobacteria bacterium]
METNKLIAACTAMVVVAGLGIAEEVCCTYINRELINAMNDVDESWLWMTVGQVTNKPYNCGPCVEADINEHNGGRYTGGVNAKGDPFDENGTFKYGKGNVFEGKFIMGQPLCGTLTLDGGGTLKFQIEQPASKYSTYRPKVGYVKGTFLGVCGQGTITYSNGDVFDGNIMEGKPFTGSIEGTDGSVEHYTVGKLWLREPPTGPVGEEAGSECYT